MCIRNLRFTKNDASYAARHGTRHLSSEREMPINAAHTGLTGLTEPSRSRFASAFAVTTDAITRIGTRDTGIRDRDTGIRSRNTQTVWEL